MMQVAKRVPFEDPNVLNACRGLYLLSNLIIMGIYLFIKTKIDAKKGTSSCLRSLQAPPHLPFRLY